jgi:hypothetical protein
MTTEAQTEANRANAQKSTGPRTPEGKAKVAQNALKHGLLAKDAVVVGEDFDEFDLFRDQFRAELAPVTMAESLLVERIVGLFWRLQRAERFHTEAFDMLYLHCAADPQVKRRWPTSPPDQTDPIFGETVVKDFSETRSLERLLVYERRIENSLYRTMAELRQVQGQRQGAGEMPLRDRRSRRSREREDRGGPFHRGPETLPPDFTLDNLLAKIAGLEDQPADATTNPPADPSCETKPIGEGVSREESQAAAPPDLPPSDFTLETAAQPPACETKPIGEEVPSLKCQVSREESHGATPPSLPTSNFTLETAAQRPLCETKPIAAGAKRERFGYTPVFRRRR